MAIFAFAMLGVPIEWISFLLTVVQTIVSVLSLDSLKEEETFMEYRDNTECCSQCGVNLFDLWSLIEGM